MYVPAAYVREALACVIHDRRGAAVSVVDRELSRYNRDQAGPRMRVPPRVSPDWPGVSDDINVGIPFHHRLEKPPVLVKLVAHQVEQPIWIVAHRQRLAGKRASRRRTRGRGRQRSRNKQCRCDEQWQDSYFV